MKTTTRTPRPLAAKGYNALRALIAEIDAAISTATRTSKQRQTFTIGRTRFTVWHTLESLQRLRAQVLKNRTAFADSALPKPAAPVVQVAQAAPEVVAVLTAADFVKLTCEQAGQLAPANARAMLGHWWMSGEGENRVHTEEGRQQIHRAWLRHTYNGDSSPIPLEVLQSHALELPAFNARCWFARQLDQRAEQAKPQPAAKKAAPAPQKAVAQAQRPRKAKPKAPPPVRDVWYYLTRAGNGSRQCSHA